MNVVLMAIGCILMALGLVMAANRSGYVYFVVGPRSISRRRRRGRLARLLASAGSSQIMLIGWAACASCPERVAL